jgi:apolipoprotein D and lipocalin family protein
MAFLSLLAGCASGHPPLSTAPHVDLPRFMGDWYVIANIPTALERGAHNAVESYRLEADGTIATTFTFRDGDFGGKLKTYHPRGFVKDRRSNAVWGMQFIWPIKADYRIVYVSPSATTCGSWRAHRRFPAPTMPTCASASPARGTTSRNSSWCRSCPLTGDASRVN